MAHRSQEELSQALAAATERVEVGARYTHFKDPSNAYEVTGLAILEADEGVAVLYKALYGDGVTFVRPLDSFTALVEHEGVQVPRFTKVI
jgi:hypothetical protein